MRKNAIVIKSPLSIFNNISGAGEITSFEKFSLETDGKNFVNILGNCKLNHFTSEQIILFCDMCSTEIKGGNLIISTMSKTEISVTGNIFSVIVNRGENSAE